MPRRTPSLFARVSVAAFVALGAGAQPADDADAPAAPKPEQRKEAPPPEPVEPPPPAAIRLPPEVYVPPSRESPRIRVGAASRGAREDAARVEVLAPSHVGHTTRASPRLGWFWSGAQVQRIEVVLREADGTDPVFSVAVEPRAGFQTLNLEDRGVRLARNRDYVWLVALRTEADAASVDQVASGGIRRVSEARALKRALAEVPDAETWRVYLRNGIWYDGLEALSARLEAEPNDAALRAAQSALFEQVGLPEAAAAVSDAPR